MHVFHSQIVYYIPPFGTKKKKFAWDYNTKLGDLGIK